MSIVILLVVFAVFGAEKSVLALGENGNFSKLLEMVVANINAAETYQIPKDNSGLLNVTSSRVIDFGTFDFIIVGAGAAGAVLANRLSEIYKWNILLLEAGGLDNDFTKIMGLGSYTYHSGLSWGYNTTPQKHACQGMKDKKCFLPQGKVVGGGTTINGGVYSRGHPQDFDRWVDHYGNEGWSYEEILPYFKKSENAVFEPRDVDYHGVGGYITVNYTSNTAGVEPVIIDGFSELGLNYVDFNGRYENGISKTQFTSHGNERVSTSSAFLQNFTNRTNLIVSLNSFVIDILIVNKTAKGVIFVKDGQIYCANAGKEVILSAGAINSAQLLILSGIGPKKHLRDLDIPLKEDLPVGQYLQDHPFFTSFYFRTNQILYNQTVRELLELYVDNKGPFTTGLNTEMMGFTNFGQSQEIRPEIEFLFCTPVASNVGLQFLLGLNDDYTAAMQTNTTSDILVSVVLLHPRSRGKLTLKSRSIRDKPLIDPNYLSEQEDIETLYKGIKFLMKLSKTKSFKKYGAEVVAFDLPNCRDYKKLTEPWWKCAIRYLTTTTYHPVATNKMGPDRKTSVVNATLHVHGINQLRVVDSSILPETNSGHTMAPTIMVAEKAADLIKECYGEL